MKDPAGFTRIRDGRTLLVVDDSLADAVQALGFMEPGALEQMLHHSPGPPGRSSTAVVALGADAPRLHVRPLRHGGWLARVWGARYQSARRPLAELAATLELRQRGAPVPRPVLVLAERRGGLWHAAFGSVLEERAVDGRSVLDQGSGGRRRIRRLARASARAIRAFHDAGGRHPDLHVGNLLFRESDDDAEALVIDLDGARVAGPPSAARRMRELMRLHRSLRRRGLAERVGVRGVAAFLAAYTRGDRSLRRALLRHGRRERRRNAVHALLYPRR